MFVPVEERALGLVSGAIASSLLVNGMTGHLVTWCDPLPHPSLTVLVNVTFLLPFVGPVPL